MKKTIGLILLITLCMIVCSLSFADDTRTSGLYTYSIKGNGTITITGFDWNANSGDIYIPSMIDGYSVTGIGNNAFAMPERGWKEKEFSRNDGSLISEPEGVIVTLPETITQIGELAFFHSPVRTINIPNSVKLIGKGAFADCPITQISVTPQHEIFASIDGALYNKKEKSLIAYPIEGDATVPEGIIRIEDYAVYGIGKNGSGDYHDAKQIICSTVQVIGEYAFAHSVIYGDIIADQIEPHAFEYAFLPDRIIATQIGSYAFAYGHRYSGHCFVDAETIGDYSFFQLDFELASLKIGNKVKEIGEYAFYTDQKKFRCFLLDQETSIQSIGTHAFDGIYCVIASFDGNGAGSNISPVATNMTKYCLTTVEPYAFKGAIGNAVSLNEGITEIKEYAFSECGLKSISLPSTLKTINDCAFSDCRYIEAIVFNDGLEAIGNEAFKNCEKLSSIDLPESVKQIGDNAFSGCNITSVNIPDSIQWIGSNAFEREYVTLVVSENSYGALWATENGYSYKYAGESNESLDWLNQ